MKKNLKIMIAVVLAVAAVGGCIAGWQYHQNQKALAEQEYHNTYLLVDGREIRRDTAELDLSGTPLSETEKLPELKALKVLDIRGTGISPETYQQLAQAMPNCSIRWSVPFQGSYYDHDITALTLTSLTEADFSALQWFTSLAEINADGCTDYEALSALQAARPDLKINYSVQIGNERYSNWITTLDFTNPNVEDLSALKWLPNVTTVTLDGVLPELEELIALKEQLPQITFVWEFDFIGQRVNTLTEYIDISRIRLEDTAALEALLPCFYNLKKVDMVNCGLSNEAMDQLNQHHPETRFIWEVNICGHMVRTDITFFMPRQYRIMNSEYANYSNLRYCVDLVVVDMGHYIVPDLSFVRYLPKLEYLLLCDAKLKDISVLAECTNLKFLELFLNPVTDFWPLTSLTNLEDLNISYTPCIQNMPPREYGDLGDITPLLQMTWLDRLWISGYENTTDEEQQLLREALPNTQLCFQTGSSTTCGWRYSPNYYVMRDILGMPYMLT